MAPRKKKPGKVSDATTEIEDLDVREVSVVDRPAIRRKFLIVKCEDGLEVIRQQEDQQMAPKATEAENLDQDDILDLLDVHKDEELDQSTEASKLVDRLMVLATTIKAEDGDTISEAVIDELASITEGLVGQPVDKAETAKLTPEDAEARVSKAVGQMMIIAKRLEDGADEDVEPELAEVGSELAPLAKEDEGSNSGDGTLKVFVGQGDDPEILIHKAGAKMKRARLSAFEKAVQTLVTLLSEIKGEQPNDKNKKTQKSSEEDQTMSTKDEKDTKDTKDQECPTCAEAAAKAAKEKEEAEAAAKAAEDNKDDNGEDSVTKSWVKEQITEAVTNGLGEVTKSIKELGEQFTKAGDVVAAISKRVDELDSTAPAGEGDGDGEGEGTEKSDKPFWGGRFLK